MQNISLEPLALSEFDHFSGWFHGEAVDLLLDSPGSVASLFSESSSPLAWKVMKDGAAVAIVTITVDTTHFGHLNLVVDQSARRRGIGSEAVQLVIAEPAVKELRGLLASVSPENTGAQKILIKNGFARTGNTPEGYLEFRFE